MSARVALITGAGRGIGRAVARALARDGCDLALLARSASQLEEVANEVGVIGRRALTLTVDITDAAAIGDAFSRCRDQLGAPLILINNAGIAPSAKFLDTDLEQWTGVLDVNLTGAFLCTQAALPAMLEARHGRVINMASTAAKWGYRYTAAYCASKHGLLGLTRALAVEFADKGVTVNAVCPGFTRTDMSSAATRNIADKTGKSEAEAEAELARMTPLGRLIEPDEVARIVAFLASDDAHGVTGQAWNVDGGAVLS